MEWRNLLSSDRAGRKTDHQFSRSAFEQDYDRIIFSHPFRRLQDKTQVHPLPEHDFVHTRLTHSLEVSSVGRSLGKRAGEILLKNHGDLKNEFSLFDFGAIVAAASLTHDLGNPPFGHAGEDAISDFFRFNNLATAVKERVTESQWADLVQFEGNAQGFRILNSNLYGLRLTNATLGAFTKYPHASSYVENGERKQRRKFGYFQSEAQIFQTLADQLQISGSADKGWVRHPLAFLVEAADDICYSLIDLEDGCVLGLITFDEAYALYEGVISASKEKLENLGKMQSISEKIGYMRALAIGDLINECATTFIAKEEEILNGALAKPLISFTSAADRVKDIISVSKQKIYRAKHVVEIEASGHEVLPGLLSEFVEACLHLQTGPQRRKHENLLALLPITTRKSIEACKDDIYLMMRHLLDFISGLTDRHALSLFRKIRGISF